VLQILFSRVPRVPRTVFWLRDGNQLSYNTNLLILRIRHYNL
jgi:hypothetical protein